MNNSIISRRSLLRGAPVAAAAALLPSLLMSDSAIAAGLENPRPDGTRITPEQALAYLKSGNSRVVKGHAFRKNYSPAGKVWTDGQWPFAAILGCSDSRVQTDEVFDVTPANLFVVRNAGNVVDEDVLGSLEYAVEHLSTSLIVVMGHSNCGAVKATESVIKNGGSAGGHIDAIVNKIKPNLVNLPAGHTLADAVKANAIASATQAVSQSSIIEEAIKAGDIKVISAEFDLATKMVTFNA
jgi:carbonic anhydrase